MDKNTYGYHHVREVGDIIQREMFSQFTSPPKIAVVLGSGLGDFVQSLSNCDRRGYGKLPYFPQTTVAGHSGELVVGKFGNHPIAALAGRSHGYEGLDWGQIVFPVRALAVAGVEIFILTSSVGAINRKFAPGDLVVVSDHVSFLLGGDPLCGPNINELGVRFPDMSEAYDLGLREIALECYEEIRLPCRQHEGILGVTRGPYFETPAEVRVLESWGADLCGMSMVPEVIALNHMASSERFKAVKCLGLACVTNMAAGIVPGKIRHEDNVAAAEASAEKLHKLLAALVPKLA